MLRIKPKIVNNTPRLTNMEISRITPTNTSKIPRTAKNIGGAVKTFFAMCGRVPGNPIGIWFPTINPL